MQYRPIGIFDSGFGGLTILKDIVKTLPEYDFLYLGDNARSPYGTRSFNTIYDYTLECVKYLFEKECHLIILACNTASAKALRNIQQLDLPKIAPSRRVLGVIRPTVEAINGFSKGNTVGILGTKGTIASLSYVMEIKKLYPYFQVYQEACPMWVPLVENGELSGPGASYFVKKNLDQLFRQSSRIDTILLGCTHYPLLLPLIRQNIPDAVNIITQGPIVAASLRDYLFRHPEIESQCSKSGKLTFCTTGDTGDFDNYGSMFFGDPVNSLKVNLK